VTSSGRHVSPNACRAIAAAFLAGVFGAWSALATAQDLADADTREVSQYRLTQPALDRYGQAARSLSLILAENPPECVDEEDDSLAAMAARLDAVPGAPAALAGAGIGSREYVVFMLATFQAGMGVWALTEGQGELPPGVPPENVAFYQAHEAEFQALSGLLPAAGCEGGEDDDDWEDTGEGAQNGEGR
jgi:hypothetical protein